MACSLSNYRSSSLPPRTVIRFDTQIALNFTRNRIFSATKAEEVHFQASKSIPSKPIRAAIGQAHVRSCSLRYLDLRAIILLCHLHRLDWWELTSLSLPPPAAPLPTSLNPSKSTALDGSVGKTLCMNVSSLFMPWRNFLVASSFMMCAAFIVCPIFSLALRSWIPMLVTPIGQGALPASDITCRQPDASCVRGKTMAS
jgi:hypothetical protein